MAARGSTVMQFVPNEVYQSALPPASPAVGQLWRNTFVTPNELLAWTGAGAGNARSYAAAKAGVAVAFSDLSDDRALRVTVKNALPAQAAAPTLGVQQLLVGKSTARVARTGKNILRPGESVAINGVTMAVAGDGTVTLNGTCTSPAGSPLLFRVEIGFFLDGQYTMSMGNPVAYGTHLQMRLMEDRDNQVLAVNTSFSAGGVNRSITFALANQYVWGYAIRVEGGITYDSAVIKPQLEPGADATPYEPYNGAEYTLSLPAPAYGVAGATDDVNNIGQVAYRTKYMKFSGTEAWVFSGLQPTNANCARFQLPVADIKPGALGISSAFRWITNPSIDTTGEAISGHPSTQNIHVFIMKSRVAGNSGAYPESGSNADKVAWFKALMAYYKPEAVYELAAPATPGGVAPVPMNGVDGTNIVAGDGASIAVEYTGSGWAAVGAVQRLAVESVSISPEEGLRVDTVLTSADGAHRVPTYFNARGARYGLFRTSDGTMILGGMVLPNGRPAGVAGALVSPGAAGETRIEIETASEGSGLTRVDTAALHLVQPSFAGAAGPNPAPTGERTPIRFEAVRSTLLDAQSGYVDNYNSSIKALNSMRLVALNKSGGEIAWLLVQRTPEGGTIYTDGAYDASDRARTLSNFAPMVHMSMPTGESIVYNATARRYMLDWKSIEDEYARYEPFKGGDQSLRSVGIVIGASGHYRFAFHADLEQASSSSGAVLYVNRMPAEWTPPTARNYCTDADLAPSRIACRRAACAPLNANITTCGLVADMWCFSGEKILPVVSTAAASKALVPAGTFFTAQKIG